MTGLVLELQRAAMDSATPLTDLLRKALVVAAKLNLAQFKSWVESELNGYQSELPPYRVIRGRVVAWNPVNRRWMPCVFAHDDAAEAFSTRRVRQGVASLAALLADETKGDLLMPFNAEMEYKLMHDTNCPFPPTVMVQRSDTQGILDAVRNEVLQWSLKLESDGILGDGMSFSPQEKEAASRIAAALAPPINIVCVGQVTGSQFQQGTVGSTQSGSFSLIDLQAVSQLVHNLKTKLPDCDLADDDERAVESDIATIEAQVSSPRPKMEIINECLRSVSSIAEGTTGSIVAAEIIEGIKKLLGD